MLQYSSIGCVKCSSLAEHVGWSCTDLCLHEIDTFQTQYFFFAAYTGDSEDRKNSDLSREWIHLDRPYSQSVVVCLQYRGQKIFSQNHKMKKKENFCKKVHESKFESPFPVPLFKSFPTIPLIPPVVASDPTTEFCPFSISLFGHRTYSQYQNLL